MSIWPSIIPSLPYLTLQPPQTLVSRTRKGEKVGGANEPVTLNATEDTMALVWGVAEELLRLADMNSGAEPGGGGRVAGGGDGGGGGYGSGSGSDSSGAYGDDDADGSEDEVCCVLCVVLEVHLRGLPTRTRRMVGTLFGVPHKVPSITQEYTPPGAIFGARLRRNENVSETERHVFGWIALVLTRSFQRRPFRGWLSSCCRALELLKICPGGVLYCVVYGSSSGSIQRAPMFYLGFVGLWRSLCLGVGR